MSHCLRDPSRFVEIDGLGAALRDGAKAAAARAQIAEHHECSGFVVPALADIWAVGAFADSVQPERASQALEVVIILAHGCACLEPFRLWCRNAARRFNLNEFHHDSIVAAPNSDTDSDTD